jgi:hypothetical protein
MALTIGALRAAAAAAVWLLALPAVSARAGDIPCAVPEGLGLTGISLPESRAQVVDGKRLVVLVIGGSSMAGNAAGGWAYSLPGRLEARLRADLPERDIALVSRDIAGGSARTAADRMAASIRDTGAKLVVWETGTSAAAAGVDLMMFGTDLEAGILAAKGAKTDIILMDPQYAPSIARVMNQAPYGNAIRSAAEMANIPMLQRSALMRAWSDSGELDFDTDSPAERVKVARKLYDCLAGTLATGIVGALR